ncbi:MAG TPA: type II toxin-antitoxin system HicA family toxin [Rhizomicrobium sp.]
MSAKELVRRLRADGWVEKRKGPGDHIQFVHPAKPGRVTVDNGLARHSDGNAAEHLPDGGWKW